ncbi:beta-galactosidase (plasmid) [Arthrobacter sp. G.S.26]|uniref:beta-galactosidase n=1 Tax=Arthrobacter sp. G.S.26 TaxID=3433706 RepID=UPI003D78446E
MSTNIESERMLETPRPPFLQRIEFGGDYNPEQWSPQIWDEDVQLMRRAGVTVATVGVFSWARLEPRPGEYCFKWLDDILDRLHKGGIQVMLATATASPPPWMATLHPDSLPETAEGTRLGPGSRQHYSPSSSAFRTHALRLVEKIVERYAGHPALCAWHIGNEYGCHVPKSYDTESTTAFRAWLQQKYGTVAALNDAWCTAFWAQEYQSFEEVSVPRATPTFPNPTQMLDFDRFSSDALLHLYLAELSIVRRITPDIPVTTNFMGMFKSADYWSWVQHLDFISDDVYPDPADEDSYVGLAAQRDLMRSLAAGKPWIVMESATSAVQWRSVNVPKPRGLHRLQSLQAVARGADGILHFQWRQSYGGAERFHSSMVPHAGPESRIFKEVCSLGSELADLGQLTGLRVQADVAFILDWDSWRAVEQDAMPSTVSYLDHLLAWYRPFLRAGITVDFQPASADLSVYAMVVAPMLHVVTERTAENLARVVDGGNVLIVGCFSGVVNEDLHVWLGGYLGPLRPILGVRVEEYAPVNPGLPLAIDGLVKGTASTWQDVVVNEDAEVIASFMDGYAVSSPALTRREKNNGAAWYVATLPSPELMDQLVARWVGESQVTPLLAAPVDGVEAVQRGDITFLINHRAEEREVEIGPSEIVRLGGYQVFSNAITTNSNDGVTSRAEFHSC